jgi:hypothetical protein
MMAHGLVSTAWIVSRRVIKTLGFNGDILSAIRGSTIDEPAMIEFLASASTAARRVTSRGQAARSQVAQSRRPLVLGYPRFWDMQRP